MSATGFTTPPPLAACDAVLKKYKIVNPCSLLSFDSNLALFLSLFHERRDERVLQCAANRFADSYLLREALRLRNSVQEQDHQHPTHNSECLQPFRRATSVFLIFLSFLIASIGVTLSFVYESVWFLIAQAFVLTILFVLFINSVRLQYAARVLGVVLSFPTDTVYLSPTYGDPFPSHSVSSIRRFGVTAVHQKHFIFGQGVAGSEQASENTCYCLEVITLGEVLLIGSCTNELSITALAEEANAQLHEMREKGVVLFPPPSLFTDGQEDDSLEDSVELTSTCDVPLNLPRIHGILVDYRDDQTLIIRLHNPQRCPSTAKAILLLILVSTTIYFVVTCAECSPWKRFYWTLPSIVYSIGMLLAMNYMSCEWSTVIFSQKRKPNFVASTFMWMLRRVQHLNVKQFEKVFFRRSAAKHLKGLCGRFIPRKSCTTTKGGRRYEIELKSKSCIRRNARFTHLCEGQALTVAQQLMLTFPFLFNSSSETYAQV